MDCGKRLANSITAVLDHIAGWPWSTVAAFLAVAAAIYAVWAQISERRRVLAGEAVAELSACALQWSTQAAACLKSVQRFLDGTISRSEANAQGLTVTTEATHKIARAVQMVKLTCCDSELLSLASEVERKVNEFLNHFDRPETELLEAERTRLTEVVEAGFATLEDFAAAAGGAVDRGVRVYKRRCSIRHHSPRRPHLWGWRGSSLGGCPRRSDARQDKADELIEFGPSVVGHGAAGCVENYGLIGPVRGDLHLHGVVRPHHSRVGYVDLHIGLPNVQQWANPTDRGRGPRISFIRLEHVGPAEGTALDPVERVENTTDRTGGVLDAEEGIGSTADHSRQRVRDREVLRISQQSAEVD